jgi:CubicO group peptidase (beta-lactamase class C family)
MSQVATATDDPNFPDGLEGERFSMLIEAITTRNEKLASTFYSEHLTAGLAERMGEGSFLDLYRWVATTSGGLEFYGVRSYDPPREGTTTVVAQGRNYGAWWAIAFFYGDDPDAGLTDIRITRARVPKAVAREPFSVEPFAGELARMMDRICEQGLFSGSVLVAAGNDIIFERACGLADRELHTPINPDTRLNIGSMSKMFTAVAVAQLAERGLLSYDDPLGEFLDEEWLDPGVAERVKVHHLLSHTSALGDYMRNAPHGEDVGEHRTLDDYRDLVAGDTLAFEPGSDWLYSATGYLLLGAIIESVSGQDYFTYVQENILDPAGMDDTGWGEPGVVERLATRYIASGGSETGWEKSFDPRFPLGGPAGGGYSTARDLHRFTMSIASGELLPGETLERMWTPYEDGDNAYGYGFMLRMRPSGFVVGHEGAFPGVEGYYDIHVQTGHTVVVLTNLDGAAWPVHERIQELMTRLK